MPPLNSPTATEKRQANHENRENRAHCASLTDDQDDGLGHPALDVLDEREFFPENVKHNDQADERDHDHLGAVVLVVIGQQLDKASAVGCEVLQHSCRQRF